MLILAASAVSLMLASCIGGFSLPTLSTRTAPPFGETPGACPAALLEGNLIADGDSHLVVQPDRGPRSRLRWPSGYVVRRAMERLEVLDPEGEVVAREGDMVALGGGQLGTDVWDVCQVIRPLPTQ